MRKHRGHHSTNTDAVAEAIKATGRREAKFNDGLWHKVVNGKHFTSSTRDGVRKASKGAIS